MRDEVVLAIDLYVLLGRDVPSRPGAYEALSEELRSLPVEPELAADPRFRNTQAVRNKLYNLLWLDTGGARGREKGGEATELAWAEFRDQLDGVPGAAAEIRKAYADLQTASPRTTPDDPCEAAEGGAVLRTHRRRERNRTLIIRKLAQTREQTGALACEACGFDSERQFGIRGVIEVHHLKPVSAMRPGETTRLGDLRLVCPNCHRLIHARQPWLTWQQLVGLVHGPQAEAAASSA